MQTKKSIPFLMTEDSSTQDIRNDDFTSPITRRLFCDSVKEKDRYVYERVPITRWIL